MPHSSLALWMKALAQNISDVGRGQTVNTLYSTEVSAAFIKLSDCLSRLLKDRYMSYTQVG